MKRWEVDLITPAQYTDPYNAQIRRELLERHNASGRDYYRELFELLDTDGTERILNVGSGNGMDEVRWITEFRHQGEVVAMEVPIDKEAHENRFFIAQEQLRVAGKDNFSIAQGTAEQIPFDKNSFDVITMFQVIYHADVLAALKESQRVLKEGGKLLVTTNGVKNKKKHHKFLKKMGKKGRSRAPTPFSSRLDLRKMKKVIPIHFEPIQDIRHTDLIVVDDEESLIAYTASIDTYRRSFTPVMPFNQWKEIRTEVVDAKIREEMERSGRFTDNLDRGGEVYINTRRESALGNIATKVLLRI